MSGTAVTDHPDVPAGTALIETMRADGGEAPLLELHLARLISSARGLGFEFDLQAVGERIHRAAASGEPARLRLLLWRDGTHEVTASPLPPGAWTTASIYPEPLAEAGTWRCTCKTTARAHYDRAVAWAEASGADEALVLNARGEVMEGARSNVFIRRGDMLVTPPLASGGLGGVMRQWLVAKGAREQVLTPEDLHAAEAVYLTNAVRGVMLVDLLAPLA